MKYISIIILSFFLGAKEPNKITQLSDSQRIGTVPRFTNDHLGNPVLSWAEKDETAKINHFFFAISKDGGNTFSDKIKVNLPANYSVHAEGMPKIAFKKSGEILATFEVAKPTEKAPRASNFYFVSSKDNGKTWSEPQTIHDDQTAGKGHSFGEIATLPDGEIGFVWLDDKLGKYEGRSVKFRQTLPNGKLSPEIIVDSSACQCCRTNLLVDKNKNYHILYRDLLADGSRDISHVVSKDGGKTFGDFSVVFDDKWKINACPHTGSGVTQVGRDIYSAWFTGKENEAGVRLSKIGSGKLMDRIETNRAKHPQVGNLNDKLIMIWDQSMQKEEKFFTKIGMKIYDKDGTSKEEWLTPDFTVSTYPVIISTGKDLLIAYEHKKDIKDNSVIVVQRLSDFKM
jgi:BNR repeat-like domain